MKSIAVFGAALSLVGSAQALTLFSDDFNDSKLYSAWEVQRGYATMDTGWVKLQGSTAGTRDSLIQTLVGSDWSNYRLSTRFDAQGGGDDWYMSTIEFRVQESYGWGQGTYYRLDIATPAWTRGLGGDGNQNSMTLIKVVNGKASFFDQVKFPPGLLNDSDNSVDIIARGGNFDISINGKSAGHYHDSNPIRTGGVALGAIWEATTRYDYINVASLAVPEPDSYALMLAGLGVLGFAARRRQPG